MHAQVQSLLDNKTKPKGSLGRLEELALQAAVAQQTTRPEMERCSLIIFIADHGIAAEGVSAFPQAVTRQMAANFLQGGAAAIVFANANGVKVQLVDAGMLEPLSHPQMLDRRLGPGTANMLQRAAMSDAQCRQALDSGRQLANASRCEALCLGEMGIANTSAAALLGHKLLDLPLTQLIGRGSGLDDPGLAHKQKVLQRAAERTGPRLDGAQALREYGGFEIAMMTGAMLGAADTGKLVLVDGFIAGAAAAAALQLQPGIRPHLVFCHSSAEPGHRHMLQAMDAQPLLDLHMRLGEGTGALMAWPLLRSAVAMLNNMASFSDAGVSGPGTPA